MASRKALFITAASMAVLMGALLPAIARPGNHMVFGEQKWWGGPDVHVVGETNGWKLGVNYDDWVRVNDGIPVGDTLEFIYDQNVHNVVLVDEDDFNSCTVPNNAQMWDSGEDFLELSTAGKYFFICGMGDHCTRGMKLALTAIDPAID